MELRGTANDTPRRIDVAKPEPAPGSKRNRTALLEPGVWLEPQPVFAPGSGLQTYVSILCTYEQGKSVNYMIKVKKKLKINHN